MLGRYAGCLAIAWSLMWGGTARATTVTTTTATTSLDLVDDELRLLSESLAADAEERESPPPVPPTIGQTAAAVLQSLNPDLSLILDAAAAYFSEEPLQLGAHDPNRTGFTLQQLELHLEASVDPFFRLVANIVFAQFGVEVEEAYGTTLRLPLGLQARAGQFLTRFGRLNPTHPHTWHFVDQPLVMGKFFGGEGNRGLGVEASWLIPLPWYAEVVGSATDAGGECCARSFFGPSDLGVRGLDDVLYTTALKQFFPFDEAWSLFFGLSAQHGPNSTGNDNRTQIFGTDLYLRYRPLDSPNRTAVSWQTEALLRARQVPGDSLVDYGLYSQVIWTIDPQWETGARFEFVSGVDGDPLDPTWTDTRHRLSGQLTYYPSHFSRIRLQGAWDDPGWMTTIALELLIGAHASHDY